MARVGGGVQEEWGTWRGRTISCQIFAGVGTIIRHWP